MITKYFQLLFFTISLSSITSAQTFYIGIKTGVSHTGISGMFNYKSFGESQTNYNNISVFQKPSTLSKINSSGLLKLTSGIIMNYQFNKVISLQSEFNYEEKGFDFHCVRFGEAVYGHYKMQYLTIPFSFTYESGQTIKYYGYWGISLNMLLKAREYTSYTVIGSTSPADEYYKPTELNNKELSALAGAGIKIPLSDQIKFIIDMRLNSDITRAAKKTDYNYYFNPSMKPDGTPNNFQNVFNRSITFYWGVIYKINKEK